MFARNIILVVSVLSLVACSCGKKAASVASQVYEKASPDFNADSAYSYVDKQVAYGPRVPNTAEHVACGDYLVAELKRFGADVYEQKMELQTFDKVKLNARNIIGSFDKQNSKRVLLFAHWDSRPFSDRDQNKDNYHKPLLGANDGASGVGVLLELARNIQAKSPNIGVDIIFFDAEDWGPPAFLEDEPEGDWWCLGSQYWSKNPHVADYKAKYGILLDMVGAPDATFYKEYYSKENAGGVVEKVWSVARQLGFGSYFVSKDGGAIMDDHIPVIQNRKIPSIDIIHFSADTEHNFGAYWHTQKDDMSSISKETLKAVGQTVMEVVYLEK